MSSIMLFSIKRTAFQNVIAIKVGHFARLDYLDVITKDSILNICSFLQHQYHITRKWKSKGCWCLLTFRQRCQALHNSAHFPPLQTGTEHDLERMQQRLEVVFATKHQPDQPSTCTWCYFCRKDESNICCLHNLSNHLK